MSRVTLPTRVARASFAVASVTLLSAALLPGCHGAHPTATAAREDTARATAGDDRIDDLARKCARVTSCAHVHDAPRFRDPSACVDYWLEHLSDPLSPVPDCLSRAESCSDVESCLHGRGSQEAAAFCAAHPGTDTGCNGNDSVTCVQDDLRESTETPCAPFGAVCGEAHAAGGLVSHGCIAPALCPPDVTRARCDGDRGVLACHDQIVDRTSCAPGTSCRAHVDEDGEELATCEGSSDSPCETIGLRTCRGNSLVLCEAHGHHAHEQPVDCAALGLACGQVAGRAACTSGKGESRCATTASRCEGGALVFCAAGRTERVACDELGLSPCETEGRGPVALCGSGQPRRTRR